MKLLPWFASWVCSCRTPFGSRERYARAGEPGTEDTGDEEVHRVAWRTADGMLSCLPDYRVGEQGHRELVWQAVLGVAAKVHVNGPREHEYEQCRPAQLLAGQCASAQGGPVAGRADGFLPGQ